MSDVGKDTLRVELKHQRDVLLSRPGGTTPQEVAEATKIAKPVAFAELGEMLAFDQLCEWARKLFPDALNGQERQYPIPGIATELQAHLRPVIAVPQSGGGYRHMRLYGPGAATCLEIRIGLSKREDQIKELEAVNRVISAVLEQAEQCGGDDRMTITERMLLRYQPERWPVLLRDGATQIGWLSIKVAQQAAKASRGGVTFSFDWKTGEAWVDSEITTAVPGYEPLRSQKTA